MQEQELFQSYEVKNWDLSPRIYKILALSAIFNIVALLAVGQTNLLTTKGCDSPLVGKVCQVIDTLYVGGSVLSTNSEYVNKDFDPTELTENDEITFVNVADKLYYPEGYFAQSNPQTAMMDQTGNYIPTDMNGFPSNNPGIPNNPTINGGGTNDLLNKPQELPKDNPNAINGGIPDSPFSVGGGNPTISRPKYQKYPKQKSWKNNPTLNNTSPKLPKLTPDTTAEKDADKENKDKTETPVKSEPVPGIEVNRGPIKKFAADVKVKFDKKEIDLSQNFTVVADGVLTKDGKLDVTIDKKTKQPKSRILKSEGNEQMVEVAKQAIAAIGDSGWLGYLQAQGIDKINFTVVQDNDNLQVIITSDLPSPERANTVSSGVGGIISGALLLDKNNIKKLGEDEKILLGSAKALVNPANTKQFVLNFVLPKTVAQEMIKRKLAEPIEKPAENKPNGSTAQIKEGNQNTVK
jgi:hypothetical protein